MIRSFPNGKFVCWIWMLVIYVNSSTAGAEGRAGSSHQPLLGESSLLSLLRLIKNCLMLDAIERAHFIQKDTFLYSRRLVGSCVLHVYALYCSLYAFVFLFVHKSALCPPPPHKLVAACVTYSLKLCGTVYPLTVLVIRMSRPTCSIAMLLCLHVV
jgi:hypothetical protein